MHSARHAPQHTLPLRFRDPRGTPLTYLTSRPALELAHRGPEEVVERRAAHLILWFKRVVLREVRHVGAAPQRLGTSLACLRGTRSS